MIGQDLSQTKEEIGTMQDSQSCSTTQKRPLVEMSSVIVIFRSRSRGGCVGDRDALIGSRGASDKLVKRHVSAY